MGSPRVITNQQGEVISRRDLKPYGENIPVGTDGRNAFDGYGEQDGIRQRFAAGYERDDETGLDFAQARYYASTMGRFMSADPLAGDAFAPQSLNQYTYVANNPLKFVDPSGEKAELLITTDMNKKTGTVTIIASLGFYIAEGQNVSQEELETIYANAKQQIESTFSGTFVKDGITYTVSAQIDVKLFGSEKEAAASGVDNIVGIYDNNTIVGDNGGFARGVTYHKSGETFDRIVLEKNVASPSNMNTLAHEFGHSIGFYKHHEPPPPPIPNSFMNNLMIKGGPWYDVGDSRAIRGADFHAIFGGPIYNHTSGRVPYYEYMNVRGQKVPVPKTGYRNQTTQTVRALTSNPSFR